MLLCKNNRYNRKSGTKIKQHICIGWGYLYNTCYHDIRGIGILLSECINPPLIPRPLIPIILSYCEGWCYLRFFLLRTIRNLVTLLATCKAGSREPTTILFYMWLAISRATWLCITISGLVTLSLSLTTWTLTTLWPCRSGLLLLPVFPVSLGLIEPSLN